MKNEIIAYKVIGKRNRYGTNMNIFWIANNFGPKKFEKWRREHRAFWKSVKNYFPEYKKDKIVKAAEDSIGILCFDSMYKMLLLSRSVIV